MTTPKKTTKAKTPAMPPSAVTLARRIGLSPAPAELRFTLSFHAPKQGEFTPPAYRLFVDTTKTPWLTFQNYNSEPNPMKLADIQVPVEMTRFTLSVRPASLRKPLLAWAKALLERE